MMRVSTCQRMLPGILLGLVWGSFASALELGAPLFDEDMDARVTFEAQYERFDRDIRQEIAFSDGRFSGQQQEDRTRIHVGFYPHRHLTMRFDVGVVAAEDATNVAPLVGARVTYLLKSWGNTRLSATAGGCYIDSIEYNRSGALTPTVEIAAVRRTESYVDVGGGLQLSHAWALTPVWTLHPYANAVASWLEADGEERFTLETSGREQTDSSVGFRQDSPFVLAVGFAARANRNFGARAEARFLDTASYSAGIFFSF